MFILILIFHPQLQFLIGTFSVFKLYAIGPHNFHFLIFFIELLIFAEGLLFHVLPIPTFSYFVLSLLEVFVDLGKLGWLNQPFRNVVNWVYMTLVVIDKELLSVLQFFQSKDSEQCYLFLSYCIVLVRQVLQQMPRKVGRT